MKNRKPAIVGLAVVGLFSGYHMIFGKEKPKTVTNVASMPYTEMDKRANQYKIDELTYEKNKAEFIKILEYIASFEDLGYFDMRWMIPDEYTLIVSLDTDNAARVHNVTVPQVREVVRANKDNFGYYLQAFNNTFYNGKAKEGDLTLIIMNRQGEEIARTQKLLESRKPL